MKAKIRNSLKVSVYWLHRLNFYLLYNFIRLRLEESIAECLQSPFLVFRLNDECHVTAIAAIRNHT